jgi:hypothetical protein
LVAVLRLMTALVAMAALAPVLLTTPFASAQGEDEAAGAATTATPAPTPQSTQSEPQQSAQSDAPAESYDPPEWDSSSSYDVPPSAAEPTESEAPGDGATGAQPDGGGEAPAESGSSVVAQNQSKTIQAIWQVQVGCREYCQGTSQDQSASQASDTTQKASAIAPEGSSSSATASNESSTLQFIWQTQLGCVAFCWNTTMSQSAAQEAQTTQEATAVGDGDGAALAQNIGETIQRVWQLQEGCKVECYGISESQTISQRQATDQSASASGSGYPTSTDWLANGPGSVPSWLTAFAESIGATIQTIFQFEEASCLSHCGEEALVQAAAQKASTDQTSSAGDVPEAAPPATPTPPAADPPAPAPPGAGAPLAKAANAPGRQATATSDFERASERQAERHRGAGGGSSDGSSPPPTANLFGGGGDAVGGGGYPAASAVQASAQEGVARADSSSSAAGATTSQTGATTPVGTGPATDQVGLETASASDSGGGPSFSWLSVALLMLAALAGTLALRSRPPIGA